MNDPLCDRPQADAGLRLAMVLPDMRRAGAESVVATLCRSLVTLGVEVHLVVIAPRFEYQAVLADSGVHLHLLALIPQRAIPFYRQDVHWRIRRRLGHFFRTLKPDVAHFHLLHSLVWGGAAARAAGAQTLYTIHGQDAWLAANDWPSRWRRRLYTQAISRSECRLLAVSPSVAHHQAQWLHRDPQTIAIQSNPLDLTTWHPALDDPPHPQRVIMVGTLYPLKRVHIGLLAMHLLANHSPAATLWVVGDGPERSRLEQQAKQEELASRVFLLGVRTDIPDLFRTAGVAWLLSESEGMPMAALEAMACGIPLVATDVFGTRDLVQHEVNGLLVPLDCPEAVAQATQRLWEDAPLRRRLVAGGLATARHFETTVITKQHLAHYQKALGRK